MPAPPSDHENEDRDEESEGQDDLQPLPAGNGTVLAERQPYELAHLLLPVAIAVRSINGLSPTSTIRARPD